VGTPGGKGLQLDQHDSPLQKQRKQECPMEVPGLLGILVLIADVYAILKIVKSSVSDGKKALWITIVIILPVLGVIIWYLMGPNGSK
jgi:hypothetical protein